MEGCIVCQNSAKHMCTFCKLRFCDNHKAIHEKRKKNIHDANKFTLDLPSTSLPPLESQKSKEASIKLNQSISDDSPNQAFLDVHKHCNQESLTLSQVLKNSINMNNESLKYALAKNKIFLEAHTRNVTDIVITSDNKYIVSVSEDGTLRIWNLLSKRQECILRGHTYSIYCIAITSDDKYAISGSCDNTIRVWNLQDKIQESVLHGLTEQVDFVKLTNDDLYLISGSHSTIFRIWNLQNRTQEAVIINKVRIFPGNFVLTNDSKYIIYPSLRKLIFWNLLEKTQETTILINNTPAEQVFSMAITTDNKIIISGYSSGELIFFNNEDKKQEIIPQAHNHSVCYLTITNDNKYLVSASHNSGIKLWNIHLKVHIVSIQDHTLVHKIQITPDDKYIVYSSNNSIKIWSIHKQHQVAMLIGHTCAVRSIKFTSDGKYIVSGSNDNSVRIWSIKEKALKHILPGHTETVTGISITNGLKYLASVSHRTVRVWDIEENAQIFVQKHYGCFMKSVKLTGSNTFIAFGYCDNTVKVCKFQEMIKKRQNLTR